MNSPASLNAQDTAHALRSPSGADGWMNCPGWASRPGSSDYADEGTAAHTLAAQVLTTGANPKEFIGKEVPVLDADGAPRSVWTVTDEMANAVRHYAAMVREAAGPHEVMVEQRLSIGHTTGEDGAKGTSDAVVCAGSTLQVHDFKYGKGVRVEARANPQLMIYALGALDEFGLIDPFERVQLYIHQPRIAIGPSVWTVTVEELETFRRQVQEAAERHAAVQADAEPTPEQLSPSESACRWCRHAGQCPAQDAAIQRLIGDDFRALADETKAKRTQTMGGAHQRDVAERMAAVPMIEAWCKAVRAEVERRLLNGLPVDGFKLVEGRRGARRWADEAAVEDLLRKRFRLKVEDAYNMKVISPTDAEKLLKSKSPKRWAQLQELVTQSEGKPSVAPASDKRPAITTEPVAFDDQTGTDLV